MLFHSDLRLKPSNFGKNHPNFENKNNFMKHFMQLKMKKKKFYPKTVTFGVWGLKTSFGQFDLHKQDFILTTISG